MLYCGCVFCVCIALVVFVNGPVLCDGWLLVLWSFIYLLLILMCSINVVLHIFCECLSCFVLFVLFPIGWPHANGWPHSWIQKTLCSFTRLG